MTKQVQRRRGTATQHTSFTGAEGELSVNTTNKSVHVHDNVTAGGFEAARADMDNVTSSSILTAAGITATTAELNYVDGVTSAIQTQIDGKAGTASPTFTGTLAAAAITSTGVGVTGNITVSGTVDGRDIAADGTKLDGIEANADVTDLANVTAAGALMDSEVTNLAQVKAFDSSDYATAAQGATADAALPKAGGTMTGNLNVTGTVTADGLTVDGGANLNGFVDILSTTDVSGTDVYDEMLRLDNTSGRGAGSGIGISFFQGTNERGRISSEYDDTGQGLHFYSRQDGQGLRERLAITGRGDISFYEDTGTTAKFFWDASAESLGIGTTSPATKFDVQGVASTLGLTVLGGGAATGYIGEITNNSGAAGSRDGLKVETILSNSTTKILTAASNSIDRLVVTGAGNVGIGTSSPDRTIHLNNSGTEQNVRAKFTNGTTGEGASDGFEIGINASSPAEAVLVNYEASPMAFFTSATERMRIDSSGNVGIGTTSPSTVIDARQTSTGGSTQIRVYNTDNSNTTTQTAALFLSPDSRANGALIFAEKENADFSTSAGRDISLVFSPVLNNTQTERMRIDSSGNVGIGGVPTNASDHKSLALFGNASTGAGFIEFNDTSGNADAAIFADDGNLFINADYDNTTANSSIRFRVDGSSEKMRLDASGNLLVGKTVVNNDDNGLLVQPNGNSWFTATGNYPLGINRKSTDGALITFTKDQSTVGSIGNRDADDIFINTAGGTGSLSIGGTEYYAWSSGAIYPWTDNARDLGGASNRFDDVYATNGTIQTSDRNEKQDIAELTDAEQRVAVAAKGLLRKFRWKDAVAEKGDEARTHFGIIAQDLQAAFAAEGLDAGDYAMFISSTWTDEKTGEERTRMGVRYSELLAFIIAAI